MKRGGSVGLTSSDFRSSVRASRLLPRNRIFIFMLPIAQLFGGSLAITANANRIADDGQVHMSFLTVLAIGTAILILSSFVLTRLARLYIGR